MNRQHVLGISDLSKIFQTEQGAVKAVDHVNFDIYGAEFYTMLGPSGCGKTTTLRMIAGLDTPTSGRIAFDGEDFAKTPAYARNIGMVFQSYALFPHMTVFDNVSYGLKIRGNNIDDIKRKVKDILDMIGLSGLSGRHPADLSGGQQQRVSIARALVYNPRMLLLDEPLANLDAKLRVEMREEIRRVQRELGIMTIYVTHDQEEAMSVSDRIAVFDRGKLIQAGKPAEVYEKPASIFASDFIGKANFFAARFLERGKDGARVRLQDGTEMVVGRCQQVASTELDEIPAGFDGVIMVRPEHVRLRPASSSNACVIQRIQFLGSFVRYTATGPNSRREMIVDSPRPFAGLEEGSQAGLTIDPADTHFFHRN